MTQLLKAQQSRIYYWYPAIVAGVGMTLVYMGVGQTPLLRAIALGIVIAGISLSLRRLGSLFSIAGGVLLGITPVYWSQTGGPPTVSGWLIFGVILVAGGAALLLLLTRKELFASVALGVTLFVGLYLAFGITQKSLRLTTILAAWLLYMTIIALRQTNPRPDEPPAKPLSQRHVQGMLLIMVLGVLNDPLFTLFAPGLVLGLWLSHARLPIWYWVTLLGISALGFWRIVDVYVSMDLSFYTATQLTESISAPYLVFSAWQNPLRWLELSVFVGRQFTWVGLIFGVIGIARLSRWYPTLGVVLMVVYSCYGVFGLVYYGQDRDILLLPLLMIHAFCVTYAAYALFQWLAGTIPVFATIDRWMRRRQLFWQTSTK
jgi:hypothetical protein